MWFNKKKIVIGIIFVLCVAWIFYFASRSAQDGIDAHKNNDEAKLAFDRIAYEQAPRKYLLEYMKSLSPDEYDTQFASGNVTLATEEKVYVAYYLPNNPDTVLNHKSENYNHPESEHTPYRGGIIAFIKKDNSFSIIWESKESFSAAGPLWRIEFKDIDDDGVDELAAIVGQGARQTPALWIYRLEDRAFRLINPKLRTGVEDWMTESTQWMATFVDFKDFDNDSVFEVITSNTDIDGSPVQKIYKFNGSEYYLWKETTEPRKETNS